jgi:tetratricopeptide (TPR) repeat protein
MMPDEGPSPGGSAMGFRHHRTVELGRGAGSSLSSGGVGISARVPDMPDDAVLPAPSAPRFDVRARHQWFVLRRRSRAFGRGVEALSKGDASGALGELEHAAAARHGDAASIQLFTALALIRLDRLPDAADSLSLVVASDAPLPDRLMRQHLAAGVLEVHVTPHVNAHASMDRGGVALLLAELLQHEDRAKEATDLLETYGARTNSAALALCLADRYLMDRAYDDVERVTDPFATNLDNLTLQILILRARAQRERGALIPALITLREALRFKERDRYLLNEARYERALVYEAGGKRALARKDLERIRDHEPGFRDVAERLQGAPFEPSDYALGLLPTEAS